MLDIRRIRTNPDEIKQMLINRNMEKAVKFVDECVELDEKRREVIAEVETMKAEQNKVSKQIPALKKAGEDTTAIMDEMKELSAKVKDMDSVLSDIEARQKEVLYEIPNVPHETVPVGNSDEDNKEVRKYGDPKKFEYEPLPHWDIGENLGILDPETAAKVTGARFHFYKGLGARLERSVINFFLNEHTSNGYTEILPPFIANRSSMTGTGQLPKFAEDMFKLDGYEYYLIPTAEVPVTNMYREEIIDGNEFPMSYCAYTPCFRAEAGSAGRDTRGLIRQHQFQKVELVKFVDPVDSYEQLEKLTSDAERMLQLMKIPYRVVTLCSGDLGFSSAKTYDIEVWMPSYNRYVEISSCSNFEDFQARRAGIRYKRNPKDKAEYVHTLNGSGLAVGRTVAAILENYQNPDGSVTVPEVLVPYMGCEVIKGIK